MIASPNFWPTIACRTRSGRSSSSSTTTTVSARSASRCSRRAATAWTARPSVGEGLRLFAERQPAAVLLDLKLPDGTGLDVLRELQRRSPGIPVVVVSGYGSVTDAVEAHAGRGLRLHREADRPGPALRGPRPGRWPPCGLAAEADRETGRGRIALRDGGPIRAPDAAGLPARRDGGAHAVPGPHLRRAGNGQGAHRPRHPRALARGGRGPSCR